MGGNYEGVATVKRAVGMSLLQSKRWPSGLAQVGSFRKKVGRLPHLGMSVLACPRQRSCGVLDLVAQSSALGANEYIFPQPPRLSLGPGDPDVLCIPEPNVK